MGNAAGDGVAQIDLALDDVAPGGRQRVLEVGHEDVGARVERIDDHLPLDRAGDLHPPVAQVRRRRLHLPVAAAHALSFGQERRQFAPVQPLLALRTSSEQPAALGAEAAFEQAHECQRLGREDRLVAGRKRRRHAHP
jgi:hypothetical protein